MNKCDQILRKLRIWLHLLRILNGKLHFLCSAKSTIKDYYQNQSILQLTVFPTSPSEKTVYLKLKHIARAKFTIFKSIFRKVLEKSSLEMLNITFFTLPDISARFEYFVVIYAFLSMLLYS